MLIKSLLFTVSVLFPVLLFSQNVAVNNDGSAPHPNAILDVKGVNKGLLIPRGDAATRTALATNTAKGLMMYDTVTNEIWIHNGNGAVSGWNPLSNGSNLWQTNGALGTEIKNSNTGGFWSPAATTLFSDPGAVQPPVSTPGTRLMWMPGKSAFRVGTVTGPVFWTADSIGTWSFAGGINTRATGPTSLAFGSFTRAAGSLSSAFGSNTVASGFGSFAIGNASKAEGESSLAAGELSIASGGKSFAFGQSSKATGLISGTIGFSNVAEGNTSFASGGSTRATGDMTFSAGYGTVAQSFASTAIGQYNDSVVSSGKTGPGSTDPLFYIGNGSSDVSRHNALVVYRNGNLVMKYPSLVGSIPPFFSVPISGTGTRMMWIPEASAFRAGSVSSTQWDAANIGLYSFAAGWSTVANGLASFAAGFKDSATGNNSIALGAVSRADGISSLAAGSFISTNGDYSVGFGNGNTTNGGGSFVAGFTSFTNGSASASIGTANTANGDYSFAQGINSVASGTNAVAMGTGSVARARNSFALGRYNDSIASSSPLGWFATDPLFILGNGSSDAVRSNAMVVYKNGNTDISGYTQLGQTSEAAPSVKMKKLTATSPATQGGFTFVAHGLTASKILSITALLTVGQFQIMPNHIQTGFQYTLNVDGNNIAIGAVNGSSGSILGMPVKILIVYEE